jgi:2-polyprenyl-3-methyl-5-hydroxy-6-metoxy-1,4-benzoquinol methylase
VSSPDIHAADDWDSHWQTYGASAEFNPAQTFRRERIVELIRKHADRAPRILDIGSGTGDLSRDLRAAFPAGSILGLELSATGVKLASAKVPEARFLQCDLLASPAPPAEYRRWASVAVCSEVIEHLDNPSPLLRGARQFMAPDCWLIVTVPGGPMSAFDRFIGHRRHYSPKALSQLLESVGFDVPFAAGAGFPFFNLYRLAVLARGRRLVERAQVASVENLVAHERILLRIFQSLFRLTSARGRWGWQTIATAQLRADRR